MDDDPDSSYSYLGHKSLSLSVLQVNADAPQVSYSTLFNGVCRTGEWNG
jgi:hypothetical protein